MGVSFEEFRNELVEAYGEINAGALIRVEEPSDMEKLKLFIAIDVFMSIYEDKQLLGEEGVDWDDLIDRWAE